MTANYDVIVLGVGGFGGAAMMHLADRGLRVLGLEQFGVPHDRGSSHGQSRIIRKAYFEHPDYVPLLERACTLWRELEQRQETTLYHERGLFLSGPPDGEVICGAHQSARLHGLQLDDVSPTEARQRFPQFRFRDRDAVVFEHQAGSLDVEAAVAQHYEAARAAGAECRFETVTGWTAGDQSVSVSTDRETYHAARLVVTAGAWAASLLAELHLPLRIVRKVQLWYESRTSDWRDAPVFFFEQPQGCFYGVPAASPSPEQPTAPLKIAEHTSGETVDDPTQLDRQLHPDDVAATDAFVQRTIPAIAPGPLRHAVCMYTMTPDGHFLVDHHPRHPQVLIAAGFSGHGFKFTPVIGEALADLVVDGQTSLPVAFLKLDRPGLQPWSLDQYS